MRRGKTRPIFTKIQSDSPYLPGKTPFKQTITIHFQSAKGHGFARVFQRFLPAKRPRFPMFSPPVCPVASSGSGASSAGAASSGCGTARSEKRRAKWEKSSRPWIAKGIPTGGWGIQECLTGFTPQKSVVTVVTVPPMTIVNGIKTYLNGLETRFVAPTGSPWFMGLRKHEYPERSESLPPNLWLLKDFKVWSYHYQGN